ASPEPTTSRTLRVAKVVRIRRGYVPVLCSRSAFSNLPNTAPSIRLQALDLGADRIDERSDLRGQESPAGVYRVNPSDHLGHSWKHPFKSSLNYVVLDHQFGEQCHSHPFKGDEAQQGFVA